MKEQYFGDVNDFRKYGLLRQLSVTGRLRVGVCWMLTEADNRSDGKFLGYLGDPNKYRHRDSELFDWLKQVVEMEKDRRTARLEASDLLGLASFQSGHLTDGRKQREEYFAECAARFAGCDLVFFDPDNGLEVKSTPKGCKNSRKYLYWDEVSRFFRSGSSLLIYQHIAHEKRDRYIARLTDEARQRTRAPAVWSFRTPHVLFLLVAQERHAAGFRSQFAAIRSSWAPNQMVLIEHPAGSGMLMPAGAALA